MGELAIRRNRSFAVPRYQGVSKGEKAQGSSAGKAAARTTVTVSETLRQLMSRVSQAETHIRESRRTLQAGEGTLDEVQDSLGRMAQLAEESAQDGAPDRTALQAQVEALAAEVDRMLRSASAGGTPLFLDGDAGLEDGAEAMLYAVMGERSQSEGQVLPDWLMQGLTWKDLDAEHLLQALGLDRNASGPEILAAIANQSLGNTAAGSLAALYLGAAISGDSGMEAALTGLEQLLEKLSQGVPMDQAIEQLTNGEFSSLADFQAQFTAGTAPGMEDFLVDLLLSEAPVLSFGDLPLLGLLAGLEGVNLDLMMGLLTVLESGQDAGAQLDPAQSQAEPGPQAGAASAAAEGPEAAVRLMSAGNVQVMGRELSGVAFDEASGVLTLSGDADVTVLGTGEGEQALVLAGRGSVTLMNVSVSQLSVTAPEARVISAQESVLETIVLAEGSTLTLEGRGLLRAGTIQGGTSSALRLEGGAVILEGEEEEALGVLTVPVHLTGPVSLAAQVSQSAARGKEPFDLLWEALLPGWNQVTSMDVDGKQAKMLLMNGDPIRLWLSRGEHGNPIHTLLVRGRDKQGHPQARYAYLRWNQNTASFQELAMYPNPFAVTGGEPGQDWVYDEESHTLHILSSQVTALSGGTGTDANQVPFSGRIALADAIGTIALTLGGVECRVSAGRAFHLGRGNDVTLVLQEGSRNVFESGAGYAGVSLGEGTSLLLDSALDSGEEGVLIAAGTGGGAGIGRDSDAGRDRNSRIVIRGGIITATGTGGGAGIGAGKQSPFGAIAILGGTITSTAEQGGGAGIGGALGAAVGNIDVQGGTVTATAAFHAAAIGAGVQGECGNISITGTAKVVKAVGGDPGADIGASLFGGCGTVDISGSADIGGAQLQTRTGIALNLGEDSVTLPQFRLSAQALGLDQVNVSTQAWSQEAQRTIEAGRQWVARIQGVYRAMYGRLGGRAVQSVQRYIDAAEGLVRDSGTADALLEDMRQSIRLQPGQAVETHSKRAKLDVRHLLN